MRLAAVTHSVPARQITNEWVVEQLLWHNSRRFSRDDMRRLEERARAGLDLAGTRVRYVLGPGQLALDLLDDAGRRALAAANVGSDDIEFILYVGVGRAWVEPAMANIVQARLGLARATCFDVVDACASWLRALHIAQCYLRTGQYHCGLIVNCEAGFVTYRDWELNDLLDFEHRFASWTIGEAATATVVTSDGDDDAYFRFANFGQHYDLCVFPLATLPDFIDGAAAAEYVPMRLFSRSRELLAIAAEKIVVTFRNDARLCEASYDLLVGHAASERASQAIMAQLGISPSIYFPTHPDYGNTVSACVPLALSRAVEEGRLRRGDRVLIVVGASGISVGLGSLTF